jgi:mannose-1-phosphate guanylyltransferase/mannose-6-phosphate isomerase
MERTDKAAVIPAEVGSSDVGLWSTVWRLGERDEDGNSLRGQARRRQRLFALSLGL